MLEWMEEANDPVEPQTWVVGRRERDRDRERERGRNRRSWEERKSDGTCSFIRPFYSSRHGNMPGGHSREASSLTKTTEGQRVSESK